MAANVLNEITFILKSISKIKLEMAVFFLAEE